VKKSILLISILCLFTGMLTSVEANAKRKSCTKYQQKYQKLQDKLRESNSGKRSNKLNEQARKVFRQWQLCKQGRLKK